MIKFYKGVRGAALPQPADQSALGTMPMGPYTYCEALRTASGWGWYAYPLRDVLVKFDGRVVFVWDGADWAEPESLEMDEVEAADWPADCYRPPVFTNLFVPGIIQLWTGLLVSTAEDWSVRVGPIANVTTSGAYELYTGIVETDAFKPCPLFINLRLIETGREILFSKAKPLFQVQAVPRAAYRGENKPTVIEAADMTADDWAGVQRTVRPFDSKRAPGSYAADVRKRAKHED